MKIDICNKGESLITVFWNHEYVEGYGLLFLEYLSVFSNEVFSSRQNSVPEIFHFYYVNNTFIIASLYLAVFIIMVIFAGVEEGDVCSILQL